MIKKTLILNLIAAIAILVFSCGKKLDSPIVGKWKLTKIEIPKLDLSSDLHTNVDSLGIKGVDTALKVMASGIEQLTNMMGEIGGSVANNLLKGSIYSFDDNGELKVSKMLIAQKGKYTVDKENKEMVVTLDNQDLLYTIVVLNEEDLVLKSTLGEEWHFERK